MTRWIDELLETATAKKPEDLNLSLRSTDLVKLARDAVEEHESASRRHALSVEADPPEVVGLFDSPRLERVMDNLLGNAIKYSPQGGCVRVSVGSRDGWATIMVHDDGLGIPCEDLPHIFEPFRRGSNVVGRIGGTGIGLASAQRIVESHGGTLSVQSRPGKGSTFTIHLPLRSTDASGIVDFPTT